jgi:hypothetical protein
MEVKYLFVILVLNKSYVDIIVRFYGVALLRIWQRRRINPHCFKNDLLFKLAAGSNTHFILHASQLKYITQSSYHSYASSLLDYLLMFHKQNRIVAPLV